MNGIQPGITRVLTDDVSAASFSLDCWLANPPNGEAAPGDGTGGTQVPSDTPGTPLTNRVVHINAFAKRGVQIMGQGQIRVIAIGTGSTITYQPWFFDTTLNIWIKFGTTVTITVNTTNTAIVASIGAMAGAKFFLQVTATTGTVTNFGYGHV